MGASEKAMAGTEMGEISALLDQLDYEISESHASLASLADRIDPILGASSPDNMASPDALCESQLASRLNGYVGRIQALKWELNIVRGRVKL